MPGITANTFSKCAPAITNNLKQCGSVGLCNAQYLTTDDLTDAYMKSGEYRVMEALLMVDMEIKQCAEVQNGLYDFLMSQKVNMRKKVVPQGGDPSMLQIAPFIKARQYSPINNEFWTFSGGSVSGGNWHVNVTSAGNVPADVRSFPVGISVYLNSAGAGGAASRTAWKVVSAADGAGDTLDLVLSSLNTNSNLDAAKIDTTPTSGYLTRGGNNVSDYEKECAEKPAYLNKKMVPFWVKTSRWSMCRSSKYDQYRKLLLENNPLYREYGDVDEIEKNRQLASEFQKSFVQDFFWGKALPNQDLANFPDLEDITTFDGSDTNLGVDGDVCIGKRAEPVGVYEQMAECGRVVDLLGDNLNLPALFKAFYHIIRVRKGQNNNNTIIDVFTDTVTAELLNRGMIKYYSSKAKDFNDDGILRINMPGDGYSPMKKADFGFFYRSYPLDWPAGVTMNVITHYAFDDEITVAEEAGIGDTARRLWVLDFAGIYPGIIASNQVVQETGKLQDLAKLNDDFACVMKVHTRTQTLNSLTFSTLVECPAGNLILENFSKQVPEFEEVDGLEYPPSTTTTTAGV